VAAAFSPVPEEFLMDDLATATRKPINLADYRPPSFGVSHVALEFELDGRETRVRAKLRLHRNTSGPLRLDGKKLTLHAIAIDGEALGENRYVQDESGLTIADPPDEFELATEVSICPDQNTELSGLYMSGSGFFNASQRDSAKSPSSPTGRM
jgi:aminopeptidase N